MNIETVSVRLYSVHCISTSLNILNIHWSTHTGTLFWTRKFVRNIFYRKMIKITSHFGHNKTFGKMIRKHLKSHLLRKSLLQFIQIICLQTFSIGVRVWWVFVRESDACCMKKITHLLGMIKNFNYLMNTFLLSNDLTFA